MTSRENYTEAVARLRASQRGAEIKSQWLQALSKASDGQGRMDPDVRQDLADQAHKLLDEGPQ